MDEPPRNEVLRWLNPASRATGKRRQQQLARVLALDEEGRIKWLLRGLRCQRSRWETMEAMTRSWVNAAAARGQGSLEWQQAVQAHEQARAIREVFETTLRQVERMQRKEQLQLVADAITPQG